MYRINELMLEDEFRALVEMAPFTPFTVHTADIGDVPVTSLHSVTFLGAVLEIVVPYADSSQKLYIVPLSRIISISAAHS